ncbi:MAG: Outer membrane protein assembly factor BamB [Acidimicrobiales bacterium]|nr:MAG: hypothetical protein EDR02_02705 [Actinomycetota bacterium]MBV6507683.1 Outer membrane protein assembly factor BamB [Acidimicrobiales bacterium]RIK07612.1 MAG: hypothetical protein DCC48_03715 [Acidobacteriota bacterium]
MACRRGVLVFAALALFAAACSSSDGSQGTGRADTSLEVGGCDWAQFGFDHQRLFTYPCESGIDPDSVERLEQVWYFNTDEEVTGTPIVAGDRVFVGDWSGKFYALDKETGEQVWMVQTEEHPTVYSGQIPSTAIAAEVDGPGLVIFGGGRTVYALDGESGEEVWTYAIGDPEVIDTTEIEGAPTLVEDRVIVPYDGHDAVGVPAGILALDAATGELLWNFDPDQGADPTGCAGVWGSPSADVERRLVFAGSANCPSSPDGWGTYTESIFALDLDTGEPRWAFQPHEPNNNDIDFAGSPNLFEIDGRAVVGLGNKDGHYYVVDRETGELVWESAATGPGPSVEGSNFSTGGFIGPTAVSEGIVVGGTGVGEPPYMHAFDAATGEIAWQSDTAGPTYAPTTVVNGVAFMGGTDFTLRAYDLRTGEVLWDHEMMGIVSGGVAVVHDDLFAVAGFADPLTPSDSDTSGVYRFTLRDEDEATSTTAETTTTTAPEAHAIEANPSPCVGQPCPLPLTLKEPPAGTSPVITLRIQPNPLSITVEATGLGPPIDWLRPNSPAAEAGATTYGVFVSSGIDNPVGGVVCTFAPEEGGCTADSMPVNAESYDRITVAALVDADTQPTLQDGYDRLVSTITFEPPLVPVLDSEETD